MRIQQLILFFVLTGSFFEPIAQTSTEQIRPAIGVDFIFKNYKQKSDWVPGIAISYTKGTFRNHIMAVMLSGSFIDSAIGKIASAEKKINLEASVEVRRILANSLTKFRPFIGTGIGASFYNNRVGLFAPLGAGVQVKLTNGVVATTNIQYRIGINANNRSHWFCSVGLAGIINKKKTLKVKSASKISQAIDSSDRFFSISALTDRDHDGIADNDDKCPVSPGSLTNHGCPITGQHANQSDSVGILLAILAKNILFETNSHIIDHHSFHSLDKVALLLAAHTGVKLKIEGHTDNEGADQNNIVLSTKRAQSVMVYLMMKGVDELRLSFAGFGENRPIADNVTASGRAINRRVEFIIH